MRVSFTLKFDDYWGFVVNRLETSLSEQAKQKRYRWILSILMFFLPIISIPIFNLAFDEILLLGSIIFGVATYFIVFPFIYPITKFLPAVLTFNKNDPISYKKNYVISENDLTVEAGDTKQVINWNQIEKISEDHFRFYLYLSDHEAIILKKQETNLSEEKQSKLNEFIKAKVSHFLKVDEKYSGINQLKRIGILIIVSIFLYNLFFYQTILSAEDILDLAERDIHALFIDAEHEELKDSITQEDIDEVKKLLDSMYFKLSEKHLKPRQAELYERLEKAEKQLENRGS